MQRKCSILAVLVLAISAFCADSAVIPCSFPAATGCNPTTKDLHRARAAFSKGVKLQNQQQLADAFEQFDTAARLEPHNLNYLTAREVVRQQSIFQHIQAGNKELLQGDSAQSLNDFRAALDLDPKNEFAQQRIRDALAASLPLNSHSVRIVDESPEFRAIPEIRQLDFHYRGDSRSLLTQVAEAFGLKVQMDDSVINRQVRFDIESVDFYTAMGAASTVTHTFWTPMGPTQILIAADTLENHRQYDRMAMRTIYIPGVSSPTDLTNVSNVMRNIFDIRLISPEPQTDTLTLRAPQNSLDAATKFIEGLDDGRPEVMLEVEVYQIDHTFTRKLGLSTPTDFKLFNIPAAALVAVAGQSVQSLINQLISSGGINQANSQGIAGLLAQLQGQGNSIFSQPLATFGGGLTFEGLSLGTLLAQASLNESWVRDLQHANLRVVHGSDATFHLGEKYPVINATFAPIFNSAAISQVIGNKSFQAPFPSFSYEDIGLSLKAKPMVNRTSDVRLDLEMQLRGLAGQAVNGVPIISNREYKGSITLIDGQPAVVAGSLSHSEFRTLSGLPGLESLPVVNQGVANSSTQINDDELMIVITPHVIRSAAYDASAEIWMAR